MTSFRKDSLPFYAIPFHSFSFLFFSFVLFTFHSLWFHSLSFDSVLFHSRRYLIGLYDLHEDDVHGEWNHPIQKNTCLTSSVYRSCSLFPSSSRSLSALPVWNSFLWLFNVRWAKLNNDLWSDFSERKDTQPRTFTFDFKQSMMLLLTYSQRVNHQIQSEKLILIVLWSTRDRSLSNGLNGVSALIPRTSSTRLSVNSWRISKEHGSFRTRDGIGCIWIMSDLTPHTSHLTIFSQIYWSSKIR
jgi:hypothetical protein